LQSTTILDDSGEGSPKNLSEGSDEEELDIGALQKQDFLEQQALKANLIINQSEDDDPFAHCAPKPPFEWNPKVKGFFEFYSQQSSLESFNQQSDKYSFPSESGFYVPELDRVASRHFKEDMKASDRSKRLRALGAFNFDKKVSTYQSKMKSGIKLIYEAARSLTDPVISKAHLLKLNGSLLAMLFDQNRLMTLDRRESTAFYLGRDVEIARSLPLPKEGK
jgi:hypothetical protein